MAWLPYEQATFYAAVWAVGFLVSLLRSLSNNKLQSYRIALANSGVVGFLAVAIVTFRITESTTGVVGDVRYIGIAILVGLAAPYHQIIIEYHLKKFGWLKDVPDEQPK